MGRGYKSKLVVHKNPNHHNRPTFVDSKWRVPPVEDHIVNQPRIPEYVQMMRHCNNQPDDCDPENHKNCKACAERAGQKAQDAAAGDVAGGSSRVTDV